MIVLQQYHGMALPRKKKFVCLMLHKYIVILYISVFRKHHSFVALPVLGILKSLCVTEGNSLIPVSNDEFAKLICCCNSNYVSCSIDFASCRNMSLPSTMSYVTMIIDLLVLRSSARFHAASVAVACFYSTAIDRVSNGQISPSVLL